MNLPFRQIKSIVSGRVTGGAIDADAQAYIDAHGSLTASQETAVDKFVKGCKTDGIYSKFHWVFLFIGGTEATHKWNLIDPRDLDAAYRMTWVGTAVHNANGFNPNGSGGGYGDPHYVASTQAVKDDTHVSIYNKTEPGSNSGWICFGTDSGSNSRFAFEIDYNNTYAWDMYGTGDGRVGGSTGDQAKGFWVGTRISSTDSRVYRDNVQMGSTQTYSSAGFSLPAKKAMVGGRDGSYLPDKEFAFWSCGLGLTETQVGYLTARVETLQTDLGRAN